jgi:glutaredoxin
LAEIETPILVLYTHPDCAYSAAVKFDYDNRGVAYTEIDISVHPEAIPDLEKLTGGERITPVTVEGDQVTIGLKGIG